ncbi:MAG: N-acetylmuramoyl-L-alanine amidase [Oscillospiraceae bacterium]|nr:N-acetylmuramoyl-L-alanine amidase [Oscillospiraceae bacterium]
MPPITPTPLIHHRTHTHPTRITPRGLMLHSVGVPQPNASVFIRNWNNATTQVSVHAFVEPGRVFQTLPWDFRAWHAGGAANDTHIGVEMTEPTSIRYTGRGAEFIDNDPTATHAFVHETYATAVDLFAYLCNLYALDPLSDGVILSHAEGHQRRIASNHADVEHLWARHGLTMAQFRRDVAAKAKQGGEMGEAIPATLFRVSTLTAPLNCRAFPSTAAAIVGTFARNALVTATRQSGDWLHVTDDTVTGWASASFLTEAVPIAVDALAAAGVIHSPEYWLSHYPYLRYLDRLLVNLSELTFAPGEAAANLEDAIRVLVQAGAIQSPDYWIANHTQVPHIDTLLLRAAGMTKER